MRNLLPVLLFLTCLGCSKDKASIVGKWQMDGIFLEGSSSPTPGSGGGGTIEFNKDGTYKSVMYFDGQERVRLYGTYSYNGSILKRTVTRSEWLERKTGAWTDRGRTWPEFGDGAIVDGDHLTINTQESSESTRIVTEKYHRL